MIIEKAVDPIQDSADMNNDNHKKYRFVVHIDGNESKVYNEKGLIDLHKKRSTFIIKV